MKYKKLVTLCVVLLVVAIAGCGWHTRWRKLPQMFQMDSQAETGFVSATSWYPFTENDRNTQYDIAVVYAESEIFKGLTEILDEISVRKTLFSHRSPNTVVGVPSVSGTYCRGDRRIWLIFNDRFLKVGEYGDGVGKLYKVKPESGRALSAYITENGHHLQTYLQEMKEAALPAKTYLQKHSSEEILSDFVCATYIPDGFSSVRELSADELLRFGVLVSAQGGMEWYDQTTDQYVIPLMDLQAILDTYFENCRFDLDSLARYASYDEANAVFTAKALGFSTGSAEYTLISAEELDIETVQVVMEDSVTGNLATATAKVTENGVRFLSCIKESAQQDQSEAAILTIDPQLRQLFRSVLRNETSFTFVPSQQTMTLQDFGKKDLMTSFTVLDLEGDGVPELIVQAEGPYYSMILRYDGGLLFGYEIPYRGMMDLKADGTYCFSSGHQDHGIGRASFAEQGMETNKLIWCQSVPTVNVISPTKCEWFANGEPATEEDLTKAYDSRAYMEEVRWYDYNEETIEQLFAPAASNPQMKQYDEVRYEKYPDGRIGERFALIRKGNYWGLADGNLEIILEPERYALESIQLNTYEEVWPILPVQKDGYWGAIDYYGNMVIEPEWNYIQMFIYEEQKQVFVHDGEGWRAIPLTYTSYTDVFTYEGLSAGEPNTEWTVSDGLRVELEGIGNHLTQNGH